MLFHNKANSSSQKSGCSSKVKSTLEVCFMCQAREFGRCTSFGTLPKTILKALFLISQHFEVMTTKKMHLNSLLNME